MSGEKIPEKEGASGKDMTEAGADVKAQGVFGTQENQEGESAWESQGSQKEGTDTAGWTEVK